MRKQLFKSQKHSSDTTGSRLAYELHVRGDGSSRFLHVELSGAFTLSINVLCDCGVEAFSVAANVGDDKRVTTSLLEDANIIALLHSGL